MAGPLTKYIVIWDNGANASGEFGARFNTEEEAEAFGKEWADGMNISAFGHPNPSDKRLCMNDATAPYSYEVRAVEVRPVSEPEDDEEDEGGCVECQDGIVATPIAVDAKTPWLPGGPHVVYDIMRCDQCASFDDFEAAMRFAGKNKGYVVIEDMDEKGKLHGPDNPMVVVQEKKHD